MLAATLASILALTSQSDNGYLDYLAASELADKAEISKLIRLVSEQKETPSYLTLCRRINEAMRGPLELIRKGNSKVVYDPRKQLSWDTAYPEYAKFKYMANALSLSAHAQFADGATATATDTLIQALWMADKTGRFTMISGLVGMACTAIAIRAFDEHIGQLSAKDWARLETECTAILSTPNAVAQVFQAEAANNENLLIKELPQLEDLGDLMVDDMEELPPLHRQLVADWKKMAPAQRTSVTARVAQLLRTYNSEIQRRIAGPESGWVMPDLPQTTGLEGLMIEILVPVYQGVADGFARTRTQIRLLRLHAAIRQYLFEHRVLPQSFAKLKHKEYANDPLTGSEFVLEPGERGAYRLYSRGNSRIGQIELTYRRPPAGDGL